MHPIGLDTLFKFNDFCTLWFDRILWWDWSSCCMQHDKDYSNLVPKDLADRALEFCVNSHLSGMGDIMYLGVAAFGMIFYIKAVIDKARGATSGSN